MNDTISRQAAIDAHCELCGDRGKCNCDICPDVEVFQLLPSAQPSFSRDQENDHSVEAGKKVERPEPCEGDPRADVYYLAEKIGIHRLYALVVELRGEPEPCVDAVSRQAAIDETWKYPSYTDPLNVLTEVRERIEILPSAQPEVIHCEDCAKCQIDSIYHDYWCNGQKVWKTHYCGYAERRTDGSD